MKKCNKCLEDKPQEQFAIKKGRNGKTRLNYLCKPCTRLIRRTTEKNLKASIEALRNNKNTLLTCKTCEYSGEPSYFRITAKGFRINGEHKFNCKICANAKASEMYTMRKVKKISKITEKCCIDCLETKPIRESDFSVKNFDNKSLRCLPCDQELKNQRKKRNNENAIEYRKLYYIKNKDKIDAKNKRHYLNNKSSYLEKTQKRKRAKVSHSIKMRQEHHKELKDLYKAAEELAFLNQDGKKFHVDHIIPLNHKDACGLHVPWNMQLLYEEQNLCKSSRFDYTYDNNGWKLIYERYKKRR